MENEDSEEQANIDWSANFVAKVKFFEFKNGDNEGDLHDIHENCSVEYVDLFICLKLVFFFV
jgi:hypothetical protein